MDVTDIARWQFGIITVYHFFFVPITIGTSGIIAIFQTMWLRTKNPDYLRLTKFFGKLFLINFAIGVVTGIVQEFQFGMNWSDYSRFVGDVFGAPLAMEGLIAFFLESTFLGLWIFGWDRLPRRIHLASIWLVHIGTLFSSYFILAANSWMQYPVGYRFNPETGRAELTDIWAVLFSKVQLSGFPHVILAAYMTGGAFVLAVSAYLHRRNRKMVDAEAFADHPDTALHLKAIRLGAAVTLIAGLGVVISGDIQGKVMTDVQPMKMAAAEATYETEKPAAFSILTIGTPDGKTEKFSIKVPYVLSFLATGTLDGEVEGINPLREKYREQYGQDPGEAYYHPTDYVPVIPVTYWSFRFMMGLGFFAAAGAALILWLTRKRRCAAAPWFGWLAMSLPVSLVLANSWGWIFTEMGRQPWVVFGLMTVGNAASPGITTTEAWISLLALTGLYAVLAVVELGLMWRYVRMGPDEYQEPPDPRWGGDHDDDAPLAFAY